MLTASSLTELARFLNFLGNEQRLNILRTLIGKEKYAREISEELGISRPLVAIYLKQLEKAGLVAGENRMSDEPPYLRRYYRTVPFELVINTKLLESLDWDGKGV